MAPTVPNQVWSYKAVPSTVVSEYHVDDIMIYHVSVSSLFHCFCRLPLPSVIVIVWEIGVTNMPGSWISKPPAWYLDFMVILSGPSTLNP